MDEGRVTNNSGTLEYAYDIKDHPSTVLRTGLGNVRVTVKQNGTLAQANHYYPFGLKMALLGHAGTTENKFTYNGKELEDDFNLNWYHYGARYYDPQLGRWHVVDPLDEFQSVYLYIGNDPINSIDPDGAGELRIREVQFAKVIPGDQTDGRLHHAHLFLDDPTKKFEINIDKPSTLILDNPDNLELNNIGFSAQGSILGSGGTIFVEPDATGYVTIISGLDDLELIEAAETVINQYSKASRIEQEGLSPTLKKGTGYYILDEQYDRDGYTNCHGFVKDVLKVYDKNNGTNYADQYNPTDPIPDNNTTSTTLDPLSMPNTKQ